MTEDKFGKIVKRLMDSKTPLRIMTSSTHTLYDGVIVDADSDFLVLKPSNKNEERQLFFRGGIALMTFQEPKS